jgi:hypothetical protein
MDFIPMQYFIAVPYIIIFILVFYFAGRIEQLKRRLQNAIKVSTHAREDMDACYTACNDLNREVNEHRVILSGVITTMVSRNIYLEISIFREIYGVWELNNDVFNYRIQEILTQLIYYRLVTTSTSLSDFNELLSRAKRLGGAEWVQERFMNKIQHPDNMSDLIVDVQLASGDLYLIDECIRGVLKEYPEENVTTPQPKLIH